MLTKLLRAFGLLPRPDITVAALAWWELRASRSRGYEE